MATINAKIFKVCEYEDVPESEPRLVATHLVRALTAAGAERFIRAKFIPPALVASLPTQDELIDLTGGGVPIQSALS